MQSGRSSSQILPVPLVPGPLGDPRLCCLSFSACCLPLLTLLWPSWPPCCSWSSLDVLLSQNHCACFYPSLENTFQIDPHGLFLPQLLQLCSNTTFSVSTLLTTLSPAACSITFLHYLFASGTHHFLLYHLTDISVWFRGLPLCESKLPGNGISVSLTLSLQHRRHCLAHNRSSLNIVKWVNEGSSWWRGRAGVQRCSTPLGN